MNDTRSSCTSSPTWGPVPPRFFAHRAFWVLTCVTWSIWLVIGKQSLSISLMTAIVPFDCKTLGITPISKATINLIQDLSAEQLARFSQLVKTNKLTFVMLFYIDLQNPEIELCPLFDDKVWEMQHQFVHQGEVKVTWERMMILLKSGLRVFGSKTKHSKEYVFHMAASELNRNCLIEKYQIMNTASLEGSSL